MKEPNQTHEALTKEEREIYLEHHPAKTNSSDTRDLLTRVGLVEDLKVPPCRKTISIPGSSLTGSGLPGTFRNLPRSLRCRGKHPEDLRAFGGVVTAFGHPKVSLP